MEHVSAYYKTQISEPVLDLNEMFPRKQKPDQLLAPPMERGLGSGSSIGSGYSMDSYIDQTIPLSPISSYAASPISDGRLTRRESLYDSSRNSNLSPEPAEESLEPGIELPPFNIETQGDPRIDWYMYYDFVVTKTEAHYELQRGYLQTKQYPQQVKSERIMFKGKKCHPCRFPNCESDPFTRHYDLERHFRTFHKPTKEVFYCDYPRCTHEDAFRKDHLREHYREYHKEDLTKRGGPRPKKCDKDKKNSKRGSEKQETMEEFLASRNLKTLSWWRCSKCVQRVDISNDEYLCPRCNLSCEQERIEWRKVKASLPSNNSQAGDSISSFSPALMDYGVAYNPCEDGWLPDETDPGL